MDATAAWRYGEEESSEAAMQRLARPLLRFSFLGAVLAAGACAHAPMGPDGLAEAEQPRRVIVTGSHIPQRVDPRTGLPATTAPVRIWSREDLDRTGTDNLGVALSKLDSGF
jgi:hypothetical protein